MFTFAVKSRRNDSMNQDSDIRQFFQTGDFETFCKTIRNMAFNDSELCFDLLWELQRYPVYRHDRHVWDSVAPVRYAGLTRARECIYDIRKCLQKNFAAYKESYFPYAMTATSHLTIDSSKIVFADDAKELLDISLK